MPNTHPHTVRRLLASLNAVLALATLGLLGHYLLAVRPAAASVMPQGAASAGAARAARAGWEPALPVTESDLKRVFFAPAYRERRTPHWPFTGPRMAAEVPATPPPSAAPSGLDAMGRVAMILGGPRDFVIAFEFHGGRTLPFRVGEILQRSDDGGARFRLAAVTPLGGARFRITYDLLDAPGETGELGFDAGSPLPPAGGLAPVDSEEAEAAPTPR